MQEPIWVRHYLPGVPARIEKPEFPTLVDCVRASTAANPGKTAFTICFPDAVGGSLTFDEVDRLSDAFAAYLRESLRLETGDRVAIQSPNILAHPIVTFGVFKAACILVNTNPRYTSHEMSHQFRDSGAKALVVADDCVEKLPTALPQTAIQHVVTTGTNDFCPGAPDFVGPPGSLPLVEALARGREIISSRGLDVRSYAAELKPDDVAILQYTGGTTGVSKGAMLTHANLLWHLTVTRKFSESQTNPEGEVVLTVLPLYHIFAFSINLLNYFRDGSHNILIPVARPLTNLRKAFESFPITWMTGVNTLFAGLLNEPWFRAHPPKAMKVAIGGGAAMHRAVMEDWTQLVGTPIYEGYGLTETSPALAFNLIGGKTRIGTIGVPLPNVEMRFVKDDGSEAAFGEPGEIVVRSPLVMAGYWNRPDETAKVLKDGWLRTGDIGTMDEDGYVRIVDRKKDMILVSGFNVYPNEVEDCIAKLPGIVEVAVIGVPDEHTGERVKAFVVTSDPTLTPEKIRVHCREYITDYKVPKELEFLDELPKSTVGKILRRELRAEEIRKLHSLSSKVPHSPIAS